jgi:hypothetical protein
MWENQSSGTIPWKLLCCYFGLCFVAIASFLYELFCPEPTKKYSSAPEHALSCLQFISELEFLNIEKYLKRNGIMPSNFSYKSFLDKRKISQRPEQDEKDLQEIRLGMLNSYYHTVNQRRLSVRVLIQCFYIIGFVSLSIPAFVIFVRVCEELLRSL